MASDGGLTTYPEEARRLQSVAPSYIPQGLALVEGRVFDSLTIAETIVGTTLVPELIADESVVIRVAPCSHRIVVGEGQGRVGGAEAS